MNAHVQQWYAFHTLGNRPSFTARMNFLCWLLYREVSNG